MNSGANDPIPVLMDGAALPRHSHELSQPWSQEPDADFQPGTVHMAWTPQALNIDANLVDVELITMAKRDNEMLWSLGDTFEMFLKLADEPEIAELHVAPNNTRLHLAMPGPRGRRTPDSSPLQFEEMCVSPVGFTSSVVLTAKGWIVKAMIPPAVLGLNEFERGEHLRVSFSRYDASSGKEPVLSTTASHPVIDFHRPHEWTLVVLK
ncbi:MAG: hypothetical protein ACOVMP_11715 [Chthoniobacterales bacterium]